MQGIIEKFRKRLEILRPKKHKRFYCNSRKRFWLKFSSNWHINFFGWLIYLGLLTIVLRHQLLVEMTVWKTVKNRSDVNLKTKHLFLHILTRWTRICAWFVDLTIISNVIDVITVILYVFWCGILTVVIFINVLQIGKLSYSVDGFEWDCKPAFQTISFW